MNADIDKISIFKLNHNYVFKQKKIFEIKGVGEVDTFWFSMDDEEWYYIDKVKKIEFFDGITKIRELNNLPYCYNLEENKIPRTISWINPYIFDIYEVYESEKYLKRLK